MTRTKTCIQQTEVPLSGSVSKHPTAKSELHCCECGHLGVFVKKTLLCSKCYWRRYEKRNGRGVCRIQEFRRKQPARSMLIHYRCKAKKLGLPFDLDLPWFEERFARLQCEATGLPLELPRVDRGKKEGYSPWVISLDRIEKSKGYTKDNCRVVAWIFNTAKNAHNDSDVLRMAHALVTRHSTAAPRD